MSPLRKTTLFAWLPFCLSAAPIITSSGSVSVYYSCSGDCDAYRLLAEEAGTGAAYTLQATGGDRIQTGRSYLTVDLGPIFGSVQSIADGSCAYNSADVICFEGMSEFDGSIDGKFVVTGGSGKAFLRPGEILGGDACEVTINSIIGGCRDSFELTFGVPFDMRIHFFNDLYSSWDVASFSYEYRLDYARQVDTGTNYAMRSVTDSAIPEPSTLLLMTAGLMLVGCRRFSNRSARARLVSGWAN